MYKVKVKVKWSGYTPGVAQMVGRGIALHCHDHGIRRGVHKDESTNFWTDMSMVYYIYKFLQLVVIKKIFSVLVAAVGIR